ncbi:hypothetical protein [Stenotrophomonas sp. PS02289]|uniref:hypothetical protein n=1 Tax=Stenotrophomonas sp. PS02289 TaxID=2991422 RepID=UPI00249B3116|nr:hypothetical protein [Stenotrophomonas sp. PS02289]
MRTDAYTDDAICASMGLPLFEHDPACLSAKRALRILLKPSFDPEICLSFVDGAVSVVSARATIRHQFQPAPIPTDRARASLEPGSFTALLDDIERVADTAVGSGFMIDGMNAEVALFREGVLVFRVTRVAGMRDDWAAILGRVIETTWESIESPYCRNTLADAGKYAGLTLPQETEPVRKPFVGTVVLGTEEERTEVLEALRKVYTST